MSSWPWQPEELTVDSSVPSGLLVVTAASEGELDLTVHPWPQVDEAGRVTTGEAPIASVTAADKEIRDAIAMSMSLGRSANMFGFSALIASSLPDGVYALSGDSKSSVAEASNGDLSWLSPRPQHLEDALERARDAKFEPYAWALWENWRGDPELIAQIARAGEWAMEDLGLGRHETRVTIHVDGDRERFDSPWQTVTELTQQAARRFDAATIEQSCVGDELKVDVSITRGELSGREWIDNAVLLEVRAGEASGFDEAVEVRDRVMTAVERGKKRFRGSLRGEGMADRDGPGGEARLTGAPRERLESRTSHLAVLGWTYAFLLVFAFWTYPSDWPTGERIWGIGFTLLAVLLGALIGASWFLSGVELGRSTRMLRFVSGAKVAAASLLGAAVPVVVKWALSEFLGIKAG
jgi:hypothetical protein